MRRITIVNQATATTPLQVQRAVAAVQSQLSLHFCRAYDLTDVQLEYGPDTDQERIYVLDDSNQADALGYHEDVGAVPVGFVFVKTSLRFGGWESVLSHEVLEQVADPWCNTVAWSPFQGKTAVIAYEVADPVENDEYDDPAGEGVKVSNFVYPAWFSEVAAGPYDFMGRLESPLTLSSGGYAIYSTNLKTWLDVFGDKTPPHQMTPAKYSRRRRRVLRI